jgi:DNA-binding NtrC family response regulator
MKSLSKQFKIVVLEDNEFYNTILTKHLKNHINELELGKEVSFDVESYTNANDCVRNLKPDTDIAIVDYYLGENKNALDILKTIKEKCDHCKVIIISQFKNLKTYYQTLNEGAYHFIFKDRNALSKSCNTVEDIIHESLHPGI